MSLIFGLLKERGASVTEAEMWCLSFPAKRYGTGLATVHVSGRLGMGLQPYESHERSKNENHLYKDGHGNILSFDGRLDNHKDLELELELDRFEVSDSEIILSAFGRWGDKCFSRLVGDWALALWSEKDQTLFLARDHAGTRTLYFSQLAAGLLWSTQIETFLVSGEQFSLSEDYVACYLTGRPLRDRTPYEPIRAVKPAQYLSVRDGGLCQRPHWSSVITRTIRYKEDSEYEEHFLSLFARAVERRTGPGAPILAQLSGGMDSTSIVCMSDHIRRGADPAAEIVDTISFYDDSEHSFNDKSYFAIVESIRGKVGTHIDIAFSHRTFEPHESAEGVYTVPGADSFSLLQEQSFFEAVWRRGYRSILSGIGGDEVLGGVPTPFPELASYLFSGNLLKLLQQSMAWSLVDRRPMIGTISDTAKYAIGLYTTLKSNRNGIPPWISRSLCKRSEEIEAREFSYSSRAFIAPDRIDNHLAWQSIMETLPHLFPSLLYRPEYRYPYLDRDLVEFLFSIPREQLIRPGRRRALMRRALQGIVPREILERRRKAFQLRAPLRVLQREGTSLEKLFEESILARTGFIEHDVLLNALRSIADGESQWWQQMLRTIALELWLRASQYRDGNLFSTKGNRSVDLNLTA